MQTDQLLSAFANICHRMMIIGGAYDADQVRQRLLTLSVMRDHVRDEDAAGFTKYCQQKLAGAYGDMMVDMLDELYEELGLSRDTGWDEFSTKFLLS